MPKKVLIAEDHEFMIKVLGFNLNQEGYDVIVAKNGNDAIELIQNESPDLILLDIMMPGKNGYEVCKIIKANEKTASIPILMVSALGQKADAEKGIKAGAEDFITKPFSPKALISKIKSIID